MRQPRKPPKVIRVEGVTPGCFLYLEERRMGIEIIAYDAAGNPTPFPDSMRTVFAELRHVLRMEMG